MDIRLLHEADAPSLADHLKRHLGESGADGDLVFTPVSGDDDPELFQRAVKGWLLPLNQMGWRRVWGLFVDHQLVGHADLKCGVLPAGMHRTQFGMGIERPYRGQGHGRALVEKVITWTRGQKSLEWIDLMVFAHNKKAHALYEKMGFKKNGLIRDFFRVDGRSIDDVSMTLYVGDGKKWK